MSLKHLFPQKAKALNEKMEELLKNGEWRAHSQMLTLLDYYGKAKDIHTVLQQLKDSGRLEYGYRRAEGKRKQALYYRLIKKED